MAEWHDLFGLPFFDTPCTIHIVKLGSKSTFITDKYTSYGNRRQKTIKINFQKNES